MPRSTSPRSVQCPIGGRASDPTRAARAFQCVLHMRCSLCSGHARPSGRPSSTGSEVQVPERSCFPYSDWAVTTEIRRVALRLYQGCPVPQLGHATQVVTAAVKLVPQRHRYSAPSSGTCPARRMTSALFSTMRSSGTRFGVGDRRDAPARAHFVGQGAARRGFRVSITPGSPRVACGSASCRSSFITSAATIRSRAWWRRSG